MTIPAPLPSYLNIKGSLKGLMENLKKLIFEPVNTDSHR